LTIKKTDHYTPKISLEVTGQFAQYCAAKQESATASRGLMVNSTGLNQALFLEYQK
jgi:hypothetical protein